MIHLIWSLQSLGQGLTYSGCSISYLWVNNERINESINTAVKWQVKYLKGLLLLRKLSKPCSHIIYSINILYVQSLFRRVWLVTPWTVTHQVPLSMGFSRQEYWSGLLCPPPGDLLNPGMESTSFMSPALAGVSIYVESRKIVQMNLFAKKKQRHRCREQMYGHQGENGKVGWIRRMGLTYIHYWYCL